MESIDSYRGLAAYKILSTRESGDHFDRSRTFHGHGRLRLDKKSIIRQYRNLQRAKTKSNIISHYTVHVLRTTNHTYFETFSKK